MLLIQLVFEQQNKRKQAKTVLAMSARVKEDYKDYEISTLCHFASKQMVAVIASLISHLN